MLELFGLKNSCALTNKGELMETQIELKNEINSSIHWLFVSPCSSSLNHTNRDGIQVSVCCSKTLCHSCSPYLDVHTLYGLFLLFEVNCIVGYVAVHTDHQLDLERICFFILFIGLPLRFFVQTGTVDDCLPDMLRSGPEGTWEWSNNHLQSQC